MKRSSINIKRLLAICLCAVLALSLFGCGEKAAPLADVPEEDGWVCAWGTAPLVAGADETPINPGLKENTCRQQIRPSIGGDKIRLTLSNEYGDIPVKIESLHIAKLVNAEDPAIDTSTDTVITFGGSESVDIEPGATIVSDEIDFSYQALEDLAITTKFGKFAGGSSITSHTAARCSTWIISGDHVKDESFTPEKTMTSWYFISGLDVWAEAGTKAIVVIGDSITDGAGSKTGSFARYSDELARRLQENEATAGYSVVAKGIGGNAVFGGLGTACKDRFARDVLEVPGARYCVLMIGINDIGYAGEEISQSIIDEYKVMIDSCHERGIKIYAGTLTPIKGSGYYSELHEQTRQALNEFIRSDSSGFDGFIDFDAALRDPADPEKLSDEFALGNWNDYLHPSEAGYLKMGEVAYDYLVGVLD